MPNAAAPTPDRLRELARLQKGVVSRRQALDSGITRDALGWALRRGEWQRLYPGVYATFSGPAGRSALLWSALLLAGDGALLSHQTAAELLGLTDRRSVLIHVTVPGARRVAPPVGVKIHRSRRPYPPWRFARGIPPHTMTEDTVLDLADAAGTLDEAAGWVTAAFARRLTGEYPLRQALAGRNRVRWRGQLDEVITLAAGGTHSVLEYRYDRDVERAHRLPPSTRQASFTARGGQRGYRDRFYPRYGRLVIELDGREYHGEDRREADRARDNQAAAGGGATLRYGWTDVTRNPCGTAAEVFAALRERGYTGLLRPCSAGCRAFAGANMAVAGRRA